MKTKLSFLLAVIFILSMLFTSCGEASTTAQSTFSQNSSGTQAYTSYLTIEDFLFDINNPDNDKNNHKDESWQQRDVEIYQSFRDLGKLHYAEVKLEEYMIGGIIPGPYRLTYYLFPKKAFTGDYSELILAADERIIFIVEYNKDLQTIVNGFSGTCERLDNGSFYYERARYLIFEYDGIVYMLNLPKNYTGSLDWRDIIDVKYIEIEK